MQLSSQGPQKNQDWIKKGYELPQFDLESMIRTTLAYPAWLHFGPGNLFKAFPADAAQQLLDAGLTETGIIAVERKQAEQPPCKKNFIRVNLLSNGQIQKKLIASIAKTLSLDHDTARLQELFANPSLQMVSFTITEKAYALCGSSGEVLPDVAEDLAKGPQSAKTYFGRLTALLYARYSAGAYPLAMVSMDNCSHNGDRLKQAVSRFAGQWSRQGLTDAGFSAYVLDSGKISFPWTMIDKITPGPADSVRALLIADGLSDNPSFVNTEASGYLVIEDQFPNGRPPLEQAGILFTDRETVDRTERMKVCTCLNPLHTALALFGCLLRFHRIWQEMQDQDLNRLVHVLAHQEGLPVVDSPGIIDPVEFTDTVLTQRLPNPFLPDSPQRIATDTSQKLSVRFGQTIQAYSRSETHSVKELKLIPLVLSAWLRYGMGIDDEGLPFEQSPDPLLESLRTAVAGFQLGKAVHLKQVKEQLEEFLSNQEIFGADLVEVGLADLICLYFIRLIGGKGAVRKTLHEVLEEFPK